MKTIVVIGISSGIAAYKIVDLIKILKHKNIEVEVIMTKTAVAMFGKEMFERELDKKVYTDLIEERFDYREILQKREVEHIKLADKASLFVIAPATANIIGKIAHGMADDFLTTTLLAVTCPVLICPSMNVNMWNNPIVCDNLNKLLRLGYCFLPPSKGELACGYEGVGRLPEVKMIAQEIFNILWMRNRLRGKKIIVTAGGTTEPIDAVRIITNRASGKMGVVLAEECCLRGADVLLLKSKTAVVINVPQDTSDGGPDLIGDSSDGGGIRVEEFETSKDLEDSIRKHVKNYDILFHTAAVSDFLLEKFINKKLESKKRFALKLKPAPKIINKIKKWNPKILLIGFKAVYKEKEEDLIEIGKRKLKESRPDYIIVNDVGKEGIGFGAEENEVYIISPKGLMAKIDKAPKREVARKILDYIFETKSLSFGPI